MLTVEEAKKIGIRACINKIGYDFCKQHADNATSAYGEEDGYRISCVENTTVAEFDIRDTDMAEEIGDGSDRTVK